MTITCTPQELSELLGGKQLCIPVAPPKDDPTTAVPPQPGLTPPTWWGPGPYDPIRPTLTCGEAGTEKSPSGITISSSTTTTTSRRKG